MLSMAANQRFLSALSFTHIYLLSRKNNSRVKILQYGSSTLQPKLVLESSNKKEPVKTLKFNLILSSSFRNQWFATDLTISSWSVFTTTVNPQLPRTHNFKLLALIISVSNQNPVSSYNVNTSRSQVMRIKKIIIS